MEYGLIGEKLGHSFSKEIHAKIGDYPYELLELPREKLAAFLSDKQFKAINVTIPYKEAALPYLQAISPEAEKIGAVNLIVNRGGALYGYNTDYYGAKRLLERANVQVKGNKLLVSNLFKEDQSRQDPLFSKFFRDCSGTAASNISGQLDLDSYINYDEWKKN